MGSAASTVEDYLNALPPDRREALQAVRQTILDRLPEGYEEGMQGGMIGYAVPHRLYPAGYHCDPKQPLPFLSLASQKSHMALHMFFLYTDPELLAWFQDAWRKAGKRLDMGKSCVRFKNLDDVPLGVVGEAVSRVPVKAFIERYEAARSGGGASRGAAKKKSAGRKASQKQG